MCDSTVYNPSSVFPLFSLSRSRSRSLSFFLSLSLGFLSPLPLPLSLSLFSHLSIRSIQRTRCLNYEHLVHLVAYLFPLNIDWFNGIDGGGGGGFRRGTAVEKNFFLWIGDFFEEIDFFFFFHFLSFFFFSLLLSLPRFVIYSAFRPHERIDDFENFERMGEGEGTIGWGEDVESGRRWLRTKWIRYFRSFHLRDWRWCARQDL